MLRDLFAAIDKKDTRSFLSFLTDDAAFRFGSAATVRGQAAIAEAVGGFFTTIAGLRHEVSRSLSNGRSLICEGEVTYTRFDGSEITLPFVDVFEMDGERIVDYKIYMDIGPLHSE